MPSEGSMPLLQQIIKYLILSIVDCFSTLMLEVYVSLVFSYSDFSAWLLVISFILFDQTEDIVDILRRKQDSFGLR